MAGFPNVTVQDQAEFRDSQARQIDQIINLFYSLLGLAIVIALFGIVNTLGLSIFERIRELGLLRAVGATRAQLRSMIRWEAVIIAVLGAVLGLAVGVFFGWTIVRALSSQGITEFTLPVGQLVAFVVAAALAGILAASCPAAGRPGSTCSGRSPRSSVRGMRSEYTREALAEADVDADPVVQFGRWFEQAEQAGLLEPTAMTLATATPDGRPSARMVLLRGFDERGFCFYTNYESRKAAELAANPLAALVFWWGPLERQVRIEGRVTRPAAPRARPTSTRAPRQPAQRGRLPQQGDRQPRHPGAPGRRAGHQPPRRRAPPPRLLGRLPPRPRHRRVLAGPPQPPPRPPPLPAPAAPGRSSASPPDTMGHAGRPVSDGGLADGIPRRR